MPHGHDPLAALHDDIRELRAEVTRLSDRQNRTSGKVDALVDDFREERESTRKHYSDLTAVIAALSGSVKTLAETVTDMKPTVDAVVIKKHRDAGRLELIHQQWGILIAIGGFLTWLVGTVMGWWPQLWNWFQSRTG
jgi:ABC-type transporter Mla subunit MlaD